MKKSIGKFDKDSPRFGFWNWNLDTDEFAKKLIMKYVKAGLELATEEYNCVAFMRTCYDESEVIPEDPTIIYVELPLGPTDDRGPSWSFTLTDIVDDMIEGIIDDREKIAEEHRPLAEAIAARLRALSDEIMEHLLP